MEKLRVVVKEIGKKAEVKFIEDIMYEMNLISKKVDTEFEKYKVNKTPGLDEVTIYADSIMFDNSGIYMICVADAYLGENFKTEKGKVYGDVIFIKGTISEDGEITEQGLTDEDISYLESLDVFKSDFKLLKGYEPRLNKYDMKFTMFGEDENIEEQFTVEDYYPIDAVFKGDNIMCDKFKNEMSLIDAGMFVSEYPCRDMVFETKEGKEISCILEIVNER